MHEHAKDATAVLLPSLVLGLIMRSAVQVLDLGLKLPNHQLRQAVQALFEA